MKDAMIPLLLPMVSCRPLAVVRLPYRGLLFGSYTCPKVNRASHGCTQRRDMRKTYPGQRQTNQDIESRCDQEAPRPR